MKYYPVLLSDPIRGTNITTMTSHIGEELFPVVDRERTQYRGIRLPYQANDIMFLDQPAPMPELNHSVQFTLNFWMRIENFQYNNPSGSSSDIQEYAQLFVQNPSTNQFQVLYDSTNNSLVITVNIRTKLGSLNDIQANRTEIFRINDVLTLQQWQMITIILDNRDIDMYHNGKLYRSFHLANVPDLIDNNWQLYPGTTPFQGVVSSARYFHYSFNTHEVARLHKWESGTTPPRTPYFFWWTWYRGNNFTALFDNFQKPDNIKNT